MSTEPVTPEQTTPIYDQGPGISDLMDSFTPEELTTVPSTEVNTLEGEVVVPEAVATPEGTVTDPVTDTDPVIPPAKVESTFDVNNYLEQSSEGVIKSEEDFKTAIAKIKEFDSLNEKLKTVEAEKEAIFANETIKTVNRLTKEGKTDEQINEFIKLSKMDISTLDPKEVLIQREIKNGRTRDIAEIIIERKYNLDKLSLNEEVLTSEEIAANKKELEIITEIMRGDAAPIRKEMQTEFESLKTEISPSEKAIQEQAAKLQYREKLSPFVSQIQADFPKKLVIGDDSTGGALTYDVPEEFLSSIKDDAMEYFLDREVSPETVNEFVTVKKALWLYSNQKEILSAFVSQAEARGIQKGKAEFENPQGLPVAGVIPVAQSKNVDDELMSISEY